MTLKEFRKTDIFKTYGSKEITKRKYGNKYTDNVNDNKKIIYTVNGDVKTNHLVEKIFPQYFDDAIVIGTGCSNDVLQIDMIMPM